MIQKMHDKKAHPTKTVLDMYNAHFLCVYVFLTKHVCLERYCSSIDIIPYNPPTFKRKSRDTCAPPVPAISTLNM